MKTRLFSLLLAWVTFGIPSAFAQNNNSQEDREKLSYAIYQLSGIFVGVNAENYTEARAFAGKITEIKSERISSATARGVSLDFTELRALTRVRYIQLNANNQTLNAVENAAYEQFMSSHEKDLGIVAEVARNIPPQPPANPVFNQTRKSTGSASLDREIDDFYKGAAAIDQLRRLERQAPVLEAQRAQLAYDQVAQQARDLRMKQEIEAQNANAEAPPKEISFVIPEMRLPIGNVEGFLGLPAFAALDPAIMWYHANGSAARIGGMWYHANGSAAQIGGVWYHANGKPAQIGGVWYHANGKPAQIGGVWYHANGSPAQIGGVWYHANGSAAQIGGMWYHANGSAAQIGG